MRKKYLFRKAIFYKIMKLRGGAIKPLKGKKTLKVLTKSWKNTSEGSHWY